MENIIIKIKGGRIRKVSQKKQKYIQGYMTNISSG